MNAHWQVHQIVMLMFICKSQLILLIDILQNTFRIKIVWYIRCYNNLFFHSHTKQMKPTQSATQQYISHAKNILAQNEQDTIITCSILKLQQKVQVINLNFENVSSTMLLSEKWDRDYFQGDTYKVFIFTAKQQSQGRGQNQNKWFSPPGNLYMTILIECPIATLCSLFIIASTKIVETIKATTPIKQVSIKWINDVFVKDCKISGILIKSSIYGARAFAQIGIGMNIQFAPIQYTTCLKNEVEGKQQKSKITVEAIQRQLSQRIVLQIKNFNQQSKAKALQLYDKLLKFKGQKVKIYDISLQNVQHVGVFHRINEYGFAVIEQQDGTMKQLSSGRMRV